MYRKIVNRTISVFITIFFILAGAQNGSAHRDDYLDETLVYVTLEKSEVEGEYWFDYGPQSERQDNFLRHNLAMEWGITDHWMVDARSSFKKKVGKNTKFESGRIESRYRFFNEGDLPVDLALSGELNWNRLEDGSIQTGIEPRLILSRDFKRRLNITLNLSEEIPLRPAPSAFIVAAGFRYNWNHLFRFGSEIQYDTQINAGSAIPQIWFAFPYDITLKVGYSVAFDRNEESFGRIAFEVEF